MARLTPKHRTIVAAGCLVVLAAVAVLMHMASQKATRALEERGIWGRGVVVDMTGVATRRGQSGRAVVYYMVDPPEQYLKEWIVESDTHREGDTLAVLFDPGNPGHREEFNADRTPMQYLVNDRWVSRGTEVLRDRSLTP